MKRLLMQKWMLLILASGLVGLCVVWAQSTVLVGYSVYTADAGTRLPVGTALFRVSDSTGTVVSEAGVGAADPILKGRVFVDQAGTKMGLALANANASAASITFILLNASGSEVARITRSLGANQQMATYASELFPNVAPGFRGSLTFDSNQPLAAITLRENRNSRNEYLYTTLPITNLSVIPASTPVTFPHIVAGAGFVTELLLMNPTAVPMTGEVRFYTNEGQPAFLQSGGQNVSQISYTIAPNGTFQTALSAPALVSGWASAVPTSGSQSPSGSVIFQMKSGDSVVSEAGVAATTATQTARIFVDNAQTQTGVAIVNPSTTPADVTLQLLDRNGNLIDTKTQSLQANGHFAKYAQEIFGSVVYDGFTGEMDIRSTVDVAAITLKLTVNTRGDLVLTTLPVADLTRISTSARMIFPHLAIGDIFSTRLIFISTDTATVATGRINFFKSDSTAMTIPLGGSTGSQFPSQLSTGGARQFYPGNSATVKSITAVNPLDGKPSTEITVNEGAAARPRFRVIDSTGTFRDDFDVAVQILDTSIVSIDRFDNLYGESAGFSTLTLSSGGYLTTATATVVRVNSGVAGAYGVEGVVRDSASRLYLAASTEQAILVAEDLKQVPTTYAGIRRSPGLKNSLRAESQFRNPAFLAFDQSNAGMYVSDAANNVIRRVTPGLSGVVETLAGTGATGSLDGPLLQSSFNNPQGIALDDRGNLWIADSGNHVIRRVNFQDGIVQTIAGKAGSPGSTDGKGETARFNGPIGIAIQQETTAQQLERERLNLAAPPVRVLVADTGNNLIRRIFEDGTVETIRDTNVTSTQAGLTTQNASALTAFGTAILLDQPTAVASDPFGNVFVTENKSGQVKTVLNTGNVVTAAAGRTFSSPTGVTIGDGGNIVIADTNLTAQQLSYSPPIIQSITPDSTNILAGNAITISGKNFAPDSVVTISRYRMDITIVDSRTITFKTPTLPGGKLPVVIRHRGGLAQATLNVDSPGLDALPAGYITTFAGTDPSIIEGTLARSSTIAYPGALAVDAVGNLYVTERAFNRVRRIDTKTNVITTYAGTSLSGPPVDGLLANATDVSGPIGLAIDRSGNLLITSGLRIRSVDAVTRIISTIAGNESKLTASGDGGPARLATFDLPGALVADLNGDIYVVDGPARVRKISGRTGIISAFAGNSTAGYSGNGGLATQAQLNFGFPSDPTKALALDRLGNLFLADAANSVTRKVDAKTANISLVAGNGSLTGPTGDGGLAINAVMGRNNSLAFTPSGNLVIAANTRVREVNMTDGTIRTIAGSGVFGDSGENVSATSANLKNTTGTVVDAAGNLFFSDPLNSRVRRVNVNGIISTIAGTGEAIYSPDGELARLSPLYGPCGVVVDSNNRLLVVEGSNNKVRRVDLRTGIITTIAGTGEFLFSGDGGPATAATLSFPSGATVDPFGNILILSRGDERLRMISASSGTITTIAGDGVERFSGDGGPAKSASINLTTSSLPFVYNDRQFVTDSAGNIYFPDSGNNRIRKIDRQSGIISTVAGNGVATLGGDGGPATAASLNYPLAVILDAAGNLIIADTLNNRIRKVDTKSGTITTIAGAGPAGLPGAFAGENGPATAASLAIPIALAFDKNQNLYISDRNNGRIRRIDAQTGNIKTVSGGSGGFNGDGGPAANASYRAPTGITFDANGNLFVVDSLNHRIRAIRGPIP